MITSSRLLRIPTSINVSLIKSQSSISEVFSRSILSSMSDLRPHQMDDFLCYYYIVVDIPLRNKTSLIWQYHSSKKGFRWLIITLATVLYNTMQRLIGRNCLTVSGLSVDFWYQHQESPINQPSGYPPAIIFLTKSQTLDPTVSRFFLEKGCIESHQSLGLLKAAFQISLFWSPHPTLFLVNTRVRPQRVHERILLGCNHAVGCHL